MQMLAGMCFRGGGITGNVHVFWALKPRMGRHRQERAQTLGVSRHLNMHLTALSHHSAELDCASVMDSTTIEPEPDRQRIYDVLRIIFLIESRVRPGTVAFNPLLYAFFSVGDSNEFEPQQTLLHYLGRSHALACDFP